jgi:hypothetical protein
VKPQSPGCCEQAHDAGRDKQMVHR